MQRMNREQFYATLAPLDEERLKKTLWTLYWRGSAQLRERIEAERTPDGHKPAAKSATQTVGRPVGAGRRTAVRGTRPGRRLHGR
ncbi:hypothetical protein GCM10023074_42270 [Microbispora amethystogenes]|uniref:Uncharacterized protein n=1 Tax=Microbispora amethystogenes TaxID=1427754 RepID=A0ABQ4FDK2_9ACTN|nr:hypothetical protein Mam01_30700 [Microbispora amethystogenes]